MTTKANPHDIKVGDVLFYLDFKSTIRTGVVTKIGRIYAELDRGRQPPLSLRTLIAEDSHFGFVPYYKTKAEVLEVIAYNKAIDRLRIISDPWRFPRPKKVLNSDQLNRICDVLEGQAGWEHLSTFDGPKT